MKRPPTKVICVILIALVVTVGFGRAAQKEDPVQTLIKASRFLEEKPLDKDAKKVRGWAVAWVTETDKVSVTACSLIVGGLDKKYKYGGELLVQDLIGMAAFKLANPDKAKDEDAAQQAGVESTIASYEAMVKTDPKAQNAFMDSLISKRSDGTLAQYVLANNCKKSGE